MIDLQQLEKLDFSGKPVTIVGLGIEGIDFARYLARRGALVTVSDTKTPRDLAQQLQEVAALPLDLQLGSDPKDALATAEAVFVSQSVPLDSPALIDVRNRGVPIYSTVQIFLELAPGPVVGITGSSGKTTTTALLGEMFRADERPTFVGGNIGVGLLDHLNTIRAYTWSVLEISHTQLQIGDKSPHIAAVLNITPNHLDKFSWDSYKDLKANLIRYQTASDITILNHDDPEVRALEPLVKGRLFWFTMGASAPGNGVFVRDGWAVFKGDDGERPLFAFEWLKLRGLHNQENAAAAAAIAVAAGVSPDAIACAVEAFRGVPHRLERVADINGISYFNDSIATTPERTIAGLRSFAEPVVLLLGGRDKQLPLEDLALEALANCRAIVLFGESGAKLEAAMRSHPNARSVAIVRTFDLSEAVRLAQMMARVGDVVLLSPACTSYDAYDNFERRGEHFCRLVEALNPDRGQPGEEVQASHP